MNDAINITIMNTFFDAIELPTNAGKYKLLSKAGKKVIGAITHAGMVLRYAEEAPNLPEHEAVFVQELCAGVMRCVAGGQVAPSTRFPTWEDVTYNLLMNGPTIPTVSHKEWVEVMQVAFDSYPHSEALVEQHVQLFATLHDNGVNHGRFFLLQSLAWSALAKLSYLVVRAQVYPNMLENIKPLMALYMSYLKHWRNECSAAVESGEESAFVDAYDNDTGRKASNTVTFTRDTAGAKDAQKSPFPEDLAKVFTEAQDQFRRDELAKVEQNAARLEAVKAHTRAVVTGRTVVSTPSAKERALAKYRANNKK